MTETKNETLLEKEARKLRLEYQRQYRKENRDRVRRWNENYWLKKAERVRREYGEDNS